MARAWASGAASLIIMVAVDHFSQDAGVGMEQCVPRFSAHGLLEEGVGISPWVCGAPPVIMFAALFLDPYFPSSSNPTIFLDVTCINQADTDLKRLGIESLAGFLANSRELHILWSPPWCKRRWCVFELATYAAIKRDRKIIFHPLFLDCSIFWIFVGLIIVSVSNAFFVCARPQAHWLVYPISITFFSAFTYAGLVHTRELDELEKLMSDFDVNNTECRDLADSEFIMQSIRHWHGDEQRFNNYVRGPLKHRVMHGVRDAVMTYWSLLAACFPALCFGVAVVSAHAQAGMEATRFVSLFAIEAADSLIILPFSIKLSLTVCGYIGNRCSRMSHSAEGVNKILTAVETMTISLLAVVLYVITSTMANFLHSNASAGGIAYFAAWAIASCSMFSFRGAPP